MLPDSRQRAPFAHTSSSADLTSPEIISPIRAFPTSSQNAWTGEVKPNTSRNQGKHFAKKSSDDHLNGGGVYERMEGGRLPINGCEVAPNSTYLTVGSTFSLDTPPMHRRSLSNSVSRRSPSPRPFAVPDFSIPGIATIRFMCLCTLWYTCSAVSSNTGKVILNNFRYPVTLTIVQFIFVAGLCVLCARPQLGWTGRLRSPTKAILRGTLPMAVFQVGGHIFSSMAMSRVPVSTVHTIKALSPLITVLAYAALFGVSYSPATYLSLLPLTLGVMLACSFDMTVSNLFGLICAFGSTLVFVSQNIFFKKIMPTNSEATVGINGSPKLDKINLLYFSSSMAFALMVPIWLYTDALRLSNAWLDPKPKSGGPSVPMYFFLNGVVHFAQNLLAFAILSSTSPVTYSIASLVKRIAVICLAIIWFKQAVHPVQAVGITLTAVGLWMYNNAKRDVEKGEKKMRQVEAVRDGLLPINFADQKLLDGRLSPEASIGLGFGKDIHTSPKPVYPSGLANGPLSSSSAVRASGYPVPLHQGSRPPLKAQAHPDVQPYPSPPDSIPSSPPPDVITLHTGNTRHRGLSVVG